MQSQDFQLILLELDMVIIQQDIIHTYRCNNGNGATAKVVTGFGEL